MTSGWPHCHEGDSVVGIGDECGVQNDYKFARNYSLDFVDGSGPKINYAYEDPAVEDF